MAYTTKNPPIEFDFLLSYAGIANGVAEFNFDAIASATFDVALDDCVGNFTASAKFYYVASFAHTLDDCTGNFQARFIIGNDAEFHVTLDDCIGTFSANSQSKSQATFSKTLDDCVGNFSAGISYWLVESNFNVTLDDCVSHITVDARTVFTGQFSATLDDCAAFFSADYISNVRRSLYNGVNATVENGVLIHQKTAFLQLNAVKNVVSVLSNQAVTERSAHEMPFVQAPALPIATFKESLQDSTLQIGAQSRFTHEQATPKARTLTAHAETAVPIDKKLDSNLQQMIPIDSRFEFACEDVNDATHVFNVSLNNQMPPEYWYTPDAVFTFEHLPSSRSVTFETYHVGSPLEFNLTNAISQIIQFDLTETKNHTESRTVFDSVSTYTATTDFVYPFTDAKKQLTESVQRGGYRLSATVDAKKGKLLDIHKCFKSEETNVIFSHRQRLIDSGGTGGGTGGGGTFNDPTRPPVVNDPNKYPVTIPIKQVYKMQHSISVTLEDLTPIDVDSVKLSLDADSFAWSFSANLLELSQLDLVKQPADSPPVTLVITIDGTVFKMLVEKIVRNRAFAKNSISLSGRSLSALLSSPYEQPRSATQGSLLSVQQITELELLNGWTIDWQSENWNVPPGAFSYTAKTPIQVISEIAASIGAIVVPSRNSQVLKILPRYSVLPWNFDVTTPDLIIPDAAIMALSYRNIVPTQANAVYVHGTEMGGVLSRCRLNGTAGDRLSATVSNALMTNVIGTRQLGEKILADNYEQPAIQSVSLSLGGDYPLVNVGDFVRINIDGGQVRGVVNSVSIDASLDKVSQTIQIGNETTNVWSAFKEIMPSSPLLVGTVASVVGETSLMTLIDGGVVRVRGVGAVGEKWYLRAGALDSKAPALTLSEIVI